MLLNRVLALAESFTAILKSGTGSVASAPFDSDTDFIREQEVSGRIKANAKLAVLRVMVDCWRNQME
jgi:hypothetical protein